MRRHPVRAAVATAGLCLCAAMGAEFVVPLLDRPPAIDGRIDPEEWAAAVAFEGFHQVGGEGFLERRRVRGWVAADERTLYVAIRSQLPDEGELLAAVTSDSLKAVYDDSVEVYVNPTPDAPDRVDYQFLVNSRGRGGYNIHKLGNPPETEAWRGDWPQAHGIRDGYWDFECAIPAASMGLAGKYRRTTDGVWTVNLTRNWRPDWTWSAISTGYANAGLRFRFVRGGAPAVQCTVTGDRALPPAVHELTVYNPGPQPLPLKASLALVRNTMPELREEETFSLAPGERRTLRVSVDAADPTTRYELTARVASLDGGTVFYERQTRWGRAREPLRWVAGKPAETRPVDFGFAYYPSLNLLRLAVDINGLPREARPERVTAVVRDRWTLQEVRSVEFPIDAFREGRQEQRIELPPLEGDYEIAARAAGEGVPAAETVKCFERKVFPWEKLPAGRSQAVYPPFTPIAVEGRTLRTVLRTHELNDQGLWDQVTATSANTGIARPVLAAPMRYVVRIGGAEVPVQAEPLRLTEVRDHVVRGQGSFAAGALRAAFRTTWDYDGTMRVDLTLEPAGETPLEALTLEIPFAAEAAPLIHANADRIRAPVAQALPPGDGVVWDASRVACDEMPRNFCPYVYLGSAVRGLCWFAENDRGWGWDPATPNLDVERRGPQAVLRVHLVNRPTRIAEPRTITFGLLAAPVKPMLNAPGQGPHWWRYRFFRDRYRLLGTDINWFGNHSCGTVYPVGCNLYLWEMLARGSREPLSDDTIEAVVRYGRPWFEPYGEEAVRTWDAHVRHNLRAHLGGRMVFYYNRAACQELPEFETFKDEWCLEDLRAVGKGKGRGEIKVVPSESYIDFCLYWYARSFEIGANQGVYWDNFFIAPSYNTVMTDAYRRDDGTIVPAAGIWAQRELCRRTFVMMNERGMLPITFPHMTSFNPLPMMAFATVQYDWEWKYSEGDVQDRHPREYILLATTGELAGVWPVPLGDHGRLAEDPWTQRTFSAVRLVHELDGGGGWGAGWVPSHAQLARTLAAPVLAMLDRPGLVVYKYWEDRPLPVATGRPDVPAIVYSVPGEEALAAVVSYARQDETVSATVDLGALGLAAGCSVTDAETGEALPLDGATVTFPLKKHDIRLLRFAAR